ncbi:MAG TPA: hypothetical protein DD473_01925 [Planctomycetaceae bacterium]|nr:hypothetical protein [Planctomycetaceae bacterium]
MFYPKNNAAIALRGSDGGVFDLKLSGSVDVVGTECRGEFKYQNYYRKLYYKGTALSQDDRMQL